MNEESFHLALKDFRRARQEAALRQLLHRITGKGDNLLAYHDIADKLNVTGTIEHGLREILLDDIVGSVGRADDFTREFLPKKDSDAERWARVKAAVLDMKGWQPIEVYQLGDAYFVKDGNHRVSVARQLGNKTISAHVTEIKTRLPLDVDADPEEIINKTNYLHFLEVTRLDKSRPEANLYLTFCNQYSTLTAQINSYQNSLEQWENREISFEVAAARWYDDVYFPVIKLIRDQGVLRDIPSRTETDIYILISEKREQLEEALGWEISHEKAVSNLSRRLHGGGSSTIARFGERLIDSVVPELEEGPPPGQWRRQMGVATRDKILFNDILVSLQGTDPDWHLLDESIKVAQRENGQILAVHAVDHEDELENDDTRHLEKEFYRRCDVAGIEGQFAAEVGIEGNLMINRAPWVDLVATNLTFATESSPLSRLSSGVRTLIQRCPRPILVVPRQIQSPMDRALLAYDGSPKADEALFVATYLALRWNIHLGVITVKTKYTPNLVLERARGYLAGHHLVHVDYYLRDEPINQSILDTAEFYDYNLMIVGGFGRRPMQHFMLGSTVDEVLRSYRQPILICR